jgi:hypothetical protein
MGPVLALTGQSVMSAFTPLTGVKQTFVPTDVRARIPPYECTADSLVQSMIAKCLSATRSGVKLNAAPCGAASCLLTFSSSL